MELFPAQPDLCLQISPPSSKQPHSAWRGNTREHEVDLDFWKRALEQCSRSSKQDPTTTAATTCSKSFELTLSNDIQRVNLSLLQQDPNSIASYHHGFDNHNSNNNTFKIHSLRQNPFPSSSSQQGLVTSQEINGLLRPIRGIPLYNQKSSSFPFSLYHSPDPPVDSPATLALINYSNMVSSVPKHRSVQSHQHQGRFIRSRFPAKRSMRAPRMRWTTSLHALFVHAVELLGGHERATPKSVLELMDVRDLTLAHVKSHLQMYRTVKTTDKAAATSDGQLDVLAHASSGDTSDDLIPETRNPRRPAQNSSSREAWLYGKRSGGNAAFFEKEMNGKCSSNGRTSGGRGSPSLSGSSPKKLPNLEFTLGRPH